MATRIRIQYSEIQQAIQRFDTLARDIEEIQKNLNTGMAPLRDGGWIGEAADAFYTEMDNDMLPAVKRLSAALDLGASTLQKIMEIFKEAEQNGANQINQGESTNQAASGGGTGTGKENAAAGGSGVETGSTAGGINEGQPSGSGRTSGEGSGSLSGGSAEGSGGSGGTGEGGGGASGGGGGSSSGSGGGGVFSGSAADIRGGGASSGGGGGTGAVSGSAQGGISGAAATGSTLGAGSPQGGGMTGMTQRLVGTSMMQSNSLMGMLSGLSAHGGGGAVSGPSHANFTPIHAIGPAGTGQAGALAAQQAALTQGLLTNIMGHPLSIGAALASGMGLVGLAAAKGLGAGGLGNLYRITGGGGKGQPSHSRDTEDILKRFNRNG